MEIRRHREPPTRSGSRSGRWLAGLAGAALIVGSSAFESGMPLGTWRARFMTFGCALAAAVAGTLWRGFRHQHRAAPSSPAGPSPTAARSHSRGALVWLSVMVIAAVWDVLGLLTPPDKHHLTLSALVLAYQALHALVFAVWLIAGWFLFAVPIRRRARA
ncbi:MAG: hypothetical protein ACYCV7_10510 [Acidimicrobiales bacterium]